MSKIEKDRYDREVLRDKNGLRYVVDGGFAFYITDCCDASATGTEGGIACRACYMDVPWELGGLPDDDSGSPVAYKLRL